MIPVTKTYLPNKEQYLALLDKAWSAGWITNNGQLVQELESKLADFNQVPYAQFTSNGTIALQLAIRALELKGEIITTPFSYVATVNSILWEYCRPVFVDVEMKTYGIDPDLIEERITSDTVAILGTHVFGYPCDDKRIGAIARKYGLKVIYDGAHAFGCRIEGHSVLSLGDISTCSFHATKIFHTVEGGAIFVKSKEMRDRIWLLKSFGHKGEDNYYCLGINGKNSEFHAAMGLSLLPSINTLISERKRISEIYDSEFSALDIQRPVPPEEFEYNYGYYPVVLSSEQSMFAVRKVLNESDVFPRRYFYPSLNKLSFLDKYTMCEKSERLSSSILCLPLFNGMAESEIERVVVSFKKAFR